MSEDLLFTPEEKELEIDYNGKKYKFKVRGLSRGEREDIVSQAIKFTPQGRARIDVSFLNNMIVLRGLVEAPIPKTLETIKRLKSPIFKRLLREIEKLSDLTEEEEKKFEMP